MKRGDRSFADAFPGMKKSKKTIKIEWPASFSDGQRNALRGILLAYERAMSELEDDRTVVFRSEGEKLQHIFRSHKRWRKEWAKPGLCMYPRCHATSINRSHAIPLSASLKQIAEDGHVVTPRGGANGVEVVPVGIREASTFPGFCEAHEAQFAGFEIQKRMTSAHHFYLQTFRTLCREIYTQRHYKRKLITSLTDYRAFRDAFLNDRLVNVESDEPVKINGVKVENDSLEIHLAKQINDRSENLAELNSLYHHVLDALRGNPLRISMTVGVFNLQLPICLSGFATFSYEAGGVKRRAYCFLAIIPEAGETKIIMGAAKEHEKALMTYLRDESSPALLDRLESWICHGSDHWFMTPSAWNAIPHARKDAICKRILDTSHSIANSVGFSVLDGPRNHILAIVEAQLRDGKVPPSDHDSMRALLAEEKSKLNWAPPPATAS